MKETVLKSLMRLFAIVSQVNSIQETEIARKVVEEYLKHIVRNTNNIRQFLIMYDFYHNSLREREIITGNKQLSLLSVKSVIICDNINQWLDKKQRILIMVHAIEIIRLTRHEQSEDIDFIRSIALSLKIDELIFDDCWYFVSRRFDKVKMQKNILIVNRDTPSPQFRYLFRDLPGGYLYFMYIEDAEICLFQKTSDIDKIYFNDEPLEVNQNYILEPGSVLKAPLMEKLFFSDVLKVLLHDDESKKVIFSVENLSYLFKDKKPAIEPLSFSEEAGQLIGIMGASGVGKSTLINLLNGNLTPATGRVLLNGYDIHKEKESIEGLIGFVPQDDLLIEELTVFQNIYLNARLCFSNISNEIILRKVSRLLQSLGLAESANLVVGNSINTTISGGQRKRLNIALELIREPQVLFVDEPTSGLSSSETEIVIDLLKKQSYKGKLVFLNIHQPSTDTFKKLDKLIIIDKGGKMVFMGNPQESILYVKMYSQLVDYEEGECAVCGNIDCDQILSVIETKKVDEYGNYTAERQITSDEWYKTFLKYQNRENLQAGELKLDLPPRHFQPPGFMEQFKIFSIRHLLSRIADKQYLLINTIEAPVLGMVLGWFSKYNAGGGADASAYVFSGNINLPAFLFMSVIVALFLGFMVSAEEIIRDRKVIKREKFLHLSTFAYYNSKVVYLAVLLALQLFLYVLIANSILEIKGMLFHYWLILWLTALVASFTGLILSSAMRTVVSIYIAIPIILIPQILLGGAIIKFDKLNSDITNPKYVPLVGDIMPSRWTYEGLVVHQFVKNKYEKQLFEFDRKVSNVSYMLNFYLPELFDLLAEIRKNVSVNNIQEYEVKQKIELLISELEKMKTQVQVCEKHLSFVNNTVFNIATSSAIEQYLNCCRSYYINLLDESVSSRDKKLEELVKKYGGQENLIAFRDTYYNENLASTVLNKSEPLKIYTTPTSINRKFEPVFYIPESGFGRSYFFASEKRLGSFFIETYWFNALILLLMALTSYLLLVSESVNRFQNFMGSSFFQLIRYRSSKSMSVILKPLSKK